VFEDICRLTGLGAGMTEEYWNAKVRRKLWLVAFYSCPTPIVADTRHTMDAVDESFRH
jgi:hypothetical protein